LQATEPSGTYITSPAKQAVDMTPAVVTAAATAMAMTIATTPDHLIDHPVIQEHHQETEEIVLHRSPQGGEVMVVAMVDCRVTVADIHPQQETIEGVAVGFLCHPQLHLEVVLMVFMRLPKITGI
jgi:hypothetical protein